MKTLICTVGGSPGPVVHAIEQNRPDAIVLLCSQNKDKPDDDQASSILTVPSILQRASFPESNCRAIPIPDPDDFQKVWLACEEAASALTADDQVTANYTGGTKTMSAALASFAVQADWSLQIQYGRRTDLVRVIDHDRARVQHGVHVARIRMAMDQARRFEARTDYEAAWKLLDAHPSVHHLSGDSPLAAEVEALIARNKFLHAFERFDYPQAQALLRSQALPFGATSGRDHGPRLGQLLTILAWLEARNPEAKVPRTPLLVVDELVANARRAAAQGRYDDAVSRLYRATELLAQVRLHASHRIITADVDRAKLPPGFEPPVASPDGKLQLGLRRAWELLAALGDPIAQQFAPPRGFLGSPLAAWLPLRNESWLAHGFKPVVESIWRDFGEKWAAWLHDMLALAEKSK